MPEVYDECYGWYWVDEEDMDQYLRANDGYVEKTCEGCGRKVRIKPDYAYCDSCATRIEHGMDVGGY